MTAQVLQLYTDHRLGHESGEKPGLAVRGRKWAFFVVIDYPVRVLKRPVKDFDTLRHTIYHGTNYPVPRMCEYLREAGKRNGITIAATKLLATVETEAELDEDKITPEDDDVLETQPAENTESVTQPPLEDGKEDSKVQKKKTAKKPKTAKKKAVKAKTNGKTPPRTAKTKEPKQPKDPMGKEGTAKRIAYLALKAGDDNVTVTKKIRKAFPDNATPNYVGGWYRAQMKKDGLLKK